MRICVTLIVLFLSTATAWAEDDKLAADLEAIQGEWIITNTDQLGRKLVRKHEYVGRKMTHSISDAEGKVLALWKCDFELRTTENVRTIVFSNVVTVLGPKHEEEALDKKYTWIYRITSVQMIQLKGLLNTDEGPEWSINVWSRPPKKVAEKRSPDNGVILIK